MREVPELRVRVRVDRDPSPSGDHVLYWMTANRRTRSNFALQRAVWWAEELGKPLLVLEALRCGHRWASARLHRFVLDGMRDNAARFVRAGVAYHPYVEPTAGAGKGLLEALAQDACVVVTDEFPCFFLPRMVDVAAARLAVRLEEVDSNGLLPLRAADSVFPLAHAFRRFLQRTLPDHLADAPIVDPLRGLRLPELARLPRAVVAKWPAAEPALLDGDGVPAALPIDHDVAVVEDLRGGAVAAHRHLDRFVGEVLARYDEERNEPEADATSGLSPYLHFGHLSAHEVFAAVAAHEDWDAGRLSSACNGARAGWWGMGESAEAFLDQLVTWRELGFNMTSRRDDFDRWESLPSWARSTLGEHAADPREHVYDLAAFERAATHDPLWNAAQNQLRQSGRMHNYLRMLWGKKVLEWSRTPREALAVLIELNNKYALDGRNPNSYSGIFWCFGRYDRAWGPERPIFGKVRYMTSANTARKYRVADYVARWS